MSKNYTLFIINLNTLYVDIKQVMLNTVIEQEANLNTLYVDIKLKSQVLVIYCMNHLNTLYVDIKPC